MRLAILVAIGIALAALSVGVWARSGRRRSVRSTVLLAARLGATCALLVSLAEPYASLSRAGASVVVVRDVSLSARAMGSAMDRRIDGYLSSLPSGSEAAVIDFGGLPRVIRGFRPSSEGVPVASSDASLDTGATDVAGAIALASDLLPPTGDRRILLLTDGGETQGDARSTVPRLRALGIPVAGEALASEPSADAGVLDLTLPWATRVGEPVRVRARIAGSTVTSAEVLTVLDGAVVDRRSVELKSGETLFEAVVSPPTAGEHTVEVRVRAEGDANPDNDSARAHLTAAGELRVLWVSGADVRTAAFDALSGSSDAIVEYASARSLPGDASRLGQYAVVVFDDVPADVLSHGQMAALEAYVRQHGGGWLVVGGPNTLTAGGWAKTALEDAAPVEMRPQENRRPLALLLAIDKSGSMAHESGGARKLTIAQAATASAIKALSAGDEVGILAFDARPRVASPLKPVSLASEVQRAADALEPGSGTDIVRALEEAHRVLAGSNAPRKHVVLVSDGQSEGDLPRAAATLFADGVTVSAVSVGVDAQPVLQDLATAGGGRFTAADTLSDLPSILAKETRDPLDDIHQGLSPIVAVGPRALSLPPVQPVEGYVRTSPKPTARVILKEPSGDPILADWRHGSGRAMVFMSDGGNRWARAWAQDPQFAARWRAWVRSVASGVEPSAFDVSAMVRGSELRVTVAASDSGAEKAFAATVYGPGGMETRLNLAAADGGLQATLPLVEPGAYDVVVARGEDLVRRRLSYAANAERVVVPDGGLVGSIVEATGGARSPDDAKWTRRAAVREQRDTPLWRLFLLAAIVLTLLEWVIRRVGGSRERAPSPTRPVWASRLSAAKRRDNAGRLTWAVPTPVPGEVTGHLAQLRRARDQARALDAQTEA